MKSPFPGMDPYLETRWGDVHHRLVQYCCDALQLNLPGDLRARVEERVFLEADSTALRQVIPDVHIGEYKYAPGSYFSPEERGGVAVAEPRIVKVYKLPVTEGYIEIRERGGGKVITVIEFLSPTNKCGGAGQEKYLEKQKQVIESDASLVEIDLVRAGDCVLAVEERRVPDGLEGNYLACIKPGWVREYVELYTMPLRARLPKIAIPLREHEPRVPLDLQSLIEEVYAKGAYDDLDYRTELKPPLSAADAQWAGELLKAKAAA